MKQTKRNEAGRRDVCRYARNAINPKTRTTMRRIEAAVRRMCADDLREIFDALDAYGQYKLRREAKAHGMASIPYLRQELPEIIYEQMQREAKDEAETRKAVAA